MPGHGRCPGVSKRMVYDLAAPEGTIPCRRVGRHILFDEADIQEHLQAGRHTRHSAASQMINAGGDLYTVGSVLGHKSAQSTARYSHLTTDSLRGAIALIGKKVA